MGASQAFLDIVSHYAVVDERGKTVHQQDAQHHAFGIGGIQYAEHHGKHTERFGINTKFLRLAYQPVVDLRNDIPPC